MFNCNSPNCPFDLWAPGERSKIENMAFSAYAYHQSAIDDYVNLLAAADNPNDGATQTQLLYQVGLSPGDLTTEDIHYIEREVSNRC